MKAIHYCRLFMLAAAAASFGTQLADAQTLAGGKVKIENVKTHIDNRTGQLDLSFQLNLDSLRLRGEQQLVFTPQVVAGADTVALRPVVVNGRSQQIRHERLSASRRAEAESKSLIVARRNGTSQRADYAQTVQLPAAALAPGAALQLTAGEDLCGCGRLENQSTTPIARLTSPLDGWHPALAFVRPAAEARKQRAEKGEAFLSFRVNKTDIVPDLFDNARELEKITKTINLVRDDRNLEITNINIHGYASPDGSYKNNERLARERAASLRNYVASLYTLRPQLFTSASTAEDWDGLRRELAASTLANKDALLAIANSDLEPDARDQKMRRDYPQDYAAILRDIYPRLRHSDYTVSYTVRPFSVDEAKQILKTRPQQLSLEEMFLVAQTMEPGSEDFNEVFDVAARLFPSDPTANLNAACAALQRGDTSQAVQFLDKAGQSPEADNARAALAVARKDYAAAKQLFQKAAAAGSAEAKANAGMLADF